MEGLAFDSGLLGNLHDGIFLHHPCVDHQQRRSLVPLAVRGCAVRTACCVGIGLGTCCLNQHGFLFGVGLATYSEHVSRYALDALHYEMTQLTNESARWPGINAVAIAADSPS